MLTAIRWSARVLGVILAGFLLLMFVGESWGKWHTLSQLRPRDMLNLGLMGVYILGMLLAPKWERLGSLIGLAGIGGLFVMLFLTGGGFSARGVLNPYFLVLWLPVVLYLLCRRLQGRGREG
jgi:hypothetical protein